MNRAERHDAVVPAASAEALRRALIQAAIDGYERAALSGLCAEGAWEAAVSAMRVFDLGTMQPRNRSGSDDAA
jgi:hypothetical protein